MIWFRLRYLGPVVLITLCLVTLCAITAVSLLNQQASVGAVLRENVESRRVAVELEQCLSDLIALEDDRVEKVSVLHNRVRVLLEALAASADQEEEKQLEKQMSAAFEKTYLEHWKRLPAQGKPGHDEARHAATRILENDVLKPCQEFEQFNARRIEASAERHEAVLRGLAWGLAAVGGLGAVAGVVLGYGVASSLARSLRQLRVQIHDAAGKFGPLTSETEVVLTSSGDLGDLHAGLEQLTCRIEQTLSELNQREREVLRAEQLAAVGQLAAGVAHEIRNPLTSIKMLVQAGLEDAGGLAVDDLHVIEGEVRRLERLLQTFLDFARPAAPQRRPTALAPLLHDVAGLIHGRADKQKVTVEVLLPEEPVTVVADGEQLVQVLVNLCLNALDAMPSGGKLTVAVRSAPESGAVEIEVTDTGTGFTEKVLPQLFQPFVSTKDSGLGLGLVISQRILEDHGGRITAANRPEGGARLLVSVPATRT